MPTRWLVLRLAKAAGPHGSHKHSLCLAAGWLWTRPVAGLRAELGLFEPWSMLQTPLVTSRRQRTSTRYSRDGRDRMWKGGLVQA